MALSDSMSVPFGVRALRTGESGGAIFSPFRLAGGSGGGSATTGARCPFALNIKPQCLHFSAASTQPAGMRSVCLQLGHLACTISAMSLSGLRVRRHFQLELFVAYPTAQGNLAGAGRRRSVFL